MPENFEGHEERECGEHRTTGLRAWCFDCHEWCYPEAPCTGCHAPALRHALNATLEWLLTLDDEIRFSAEGVSIESLLRHAVDNV